MQKILKNKKVLIIGAIALVVIIAIILIPNSKSSKVDSEKELKGSLEKLGRQFYEDFYYPAQEKSNENITEFIAKFEKTGIKVDLENISKYSKIDKDLVNKMVNPDTKKECDKKQSYVLINPVSPYGKTDYKITVTLVCGFESKEEK